MKAMKSKRRGNEKEKRTIKKIRNYLEKRSEGHYEGGKPAKKDIRL